MSELVLVSRLPDDAPVVTSPDLALADVYRTHAADVARWAARLLGPFGDVEDVVHEVFLVLQRRVKRFDPAGGGSLRTWLYRTTLHVVQSKRRKERWRRWLAGGSPARGTPTLDPTPVQALEGAEARRAVYDALERLSERDRTLIILFELEGHSGEEIAALLDQKIGTIWVWLSRARGRFLDALDRDAVGGAR